MAFENINSHPEEENLDHQKEENLNHQEDEKHISKRTRLSPTVESDSPPYNPEWRDRHSYRSRNRTYHNESRKNHHVDDRYDNRYYHRNHNNFEGRSNTSSRRNFNNDRSRSPQRRNDSFQSSRERDNRYRNNSIDRDRSRNRNYRPTYTKVDLRDRLSNNYRGRDENYKNRRYQHGDDRYDNRYYHRDRYNSSKRNFNNDRLRTQQRDDRFKSSRDNRKVKRHRDNSRDSSRSRNRKCYQNDYNSKREESENNQRKRFSNNHQHNSRKFNNDRYRNKRRRSNQDDDDENRKTSNHEEFENKESNQGEKHSDCCKGDEQFTSEASVAGERNYDEKDDHVMKKRKIDNVHNENNRDDEPSKNITSDNSNEEKFKNKELEQRDEYDDQKFLMEGDKNFGIAASGNTNEKLFCTENGDLEKMTFEDASDEEYNPFAYEEDKAKNCERKEIDDVHSEMMEGDENSEIVASGNTNEKLFCTENGDLEKITFEDASDEEYNPFAYEEDKAKNCERKEIDDVHSEMMEGDENSEIVASGKTNEELSGTKNGNLEMLLFEDESDEEYDPRANEKIDFYGEETKN